MKKTSVSSAFILLLLLFWKRPNPKNLFGRQITLEMLATQSG
jgi:hypothetical protein